MAHFERIRDVVSGRFSPSLIQQRTAAGSQWVSIEWRRELPGDEGPTEGAFSEDIPYGLRIRTIASGWSSIRASAWCSPR